jgi:hypothetical protein
LRKLVLVFYKAGIIGMGYCYGLDAWYRDDDDEMATPDYLMPIVGPKEEWYGNN